MTKVEKKVEKVEVYVLKNKKGYFKLKNGIDEIAYTENETEAFVITDEKKAKKFAKLYKMKHEVKK